MRLRCWSGDDGGAEAWVADMYFTRLDDSPMFRKQVSQLTPRISIRGPLESPASSLGRAGGD